MNWEKRIQLMWRWSLVSVSAIALFWLAYYFIAGEMPPQDDLDIIGSPFSVSRWWDIFLGPIFSVLLVLIFTNEKIKREIETEKSGIFLLLIIVMSINLISGMVSGLALDLAVILIFGLSLGLFFGLIALIKLILSRGFYRRIANWLLAR